jgi:hypothetical protein
MPARIMNIKVKRLQEGTLGFLFTYTVDDEHGRRLFPVKAMSANEALELLAAQLGVAVADLERLPDR